jgi:hypothetical protein
MKVILISGKALHGKDLSASILKEKLESKGKKVLILHFASYLKFLAKELRGWDGVKDEKGRKCLQEIGQQARDSIPTFWVEAVANVIDVFGKEYDYALIPDARHVNEIEFFKRNWFTPYSLRIVRPDFDNGLTPEQKSHISEVALDNYKFDCVLFNDGDISRLENKLEYFLSWVDVNEEYELGE